MAKINIDGVQNCEVSIKIPCEKSPLEQLEIMEAYTKAYQESANLDKARREINCLKVIYPTLFRSIEETDLIAGRLDFLPIGFGCVTSVGGVGHYCVFHKLREFKELLDTEKQKTRVDVLYDFWQEHDVKALYCQDILNDTTTGRFIDCKYASLGTNEDLAALTKKLRAAGISLCLDFVMNHTASSHRWAKAAQAGDPKYQDYYYCHDDRTIPDQYDAVVPEVFPATAPGNFTWNEQMHKWVLTSFYPFQWDLNYRNPNVLVSVLSSVLGLANLGVEVFRIDAVPYIWKELGTNCRNLPQVHAIVRMLRIVLECVCPAVVLKGEVVMAPKELAAYFGTPEKPECHMLYNVSIMVNLWSALASGDVRLLKDQLDKLNALPENCWFVNYLRCHDDIGWGLDEPVEESLGIDPLKHKEFLYHFYEGSVPGSWAMGELYNYDEASKDARSCGTTASLCGVERALITHDKPLLDISMKRDLMMHSAMSFLRGFPMLSCGDEIVQLNGWEYKEDPDRVEDSRNLHRSPFNWENAAKRKQTGTLQKQMWDGLKSVREMRDDPAFAPEAWVTTWDAHNDAVLAVVRHVEGRTVLGLFNFSSARQIARLDSDGDIELPAEVALEPYQVCVVEK